MSSVRGEEEATEEAKEKEAAGCRAKNQNPTQCDVGKKEIQIDRQIAQSITQTDRQIDRYIRQMERKKNFTSSDPHHGIKSEYPGKTMM